MNIEFDKTVWYSPQVLFQFIEEATKVSKQKNKRTHDNLNKLLIELWSSLFFVMGINMITGRLHYVQPVDPDENTPDIRTMFERFNSKGEIIGKTRQDVEIATYTNNSVSKFEDFVVETKFSKRYAYDEKTIFLFIIENTNQNLINIKKAHENIIKSGKKHEAYILAKNAGISESWVFSVARISPDFTKILIFDVSKELKRTREIYTPVIKAKRSGKPRPSDTDCEEVVNPFLPYIK